MITTTEIAQGILDYSKKHENDALQGKKGFECWETPYYCYDLDEIVEQVEEEGWTTLEQAIREMTKDLQQYHEHAEEIRATVW